MRYPKLRRGTLLVALTAFLAWTGCSTDGPMEPKEPKPNVSAKVKTAGKSSSRVYQNVAALNQWQDLIAGPEALAKIDIPEVKNPGQALAFARAQEARVLNRLRLAKRTDAVRTSGDETIIWDLEFQEDGITYRTKLTYNEDADEAHLFVVGFVFPTGHPLTYDSTDVKAKLNRTLLDPNDDVVVSLDLLKRRRPGELVAEERARLVPDPYDPGSETTGGVLTADVSYASGSFIDSTHARLEYHEGQGGGYEKASIFADGGRSRVEVTFNVDGTGSFSELRRDGTQVQGEFDSAEGDGEGSFSLTTTFPSGHDPSSIRESGTFSINPTDETVSGRFEREVVRLNGDKELETVQVSQQRSGEVLSSTLEVQNADGSHGTLTVVEAPDVTQVSGEWTNPDETFMIFTAQAFSDESAHLVFDLYQSEDAFRNGADPLVSGKLDFFPDGSGKGTITEGDQIYDVVIHPDGSVEITPRS